jgi:hypothetical protein
MTEHLSHRQRWLFPLTILLAIPFALSCGKRANPAPKPPPPPPVEFLGSWGEKGDGPGKLNSPNAFTSDSLGRIYFTDSGSGFVHKFESNGTPLLSFEDSNAAHASGIAVDSGGAIYLAEAERGNILVFFPDGTFLRAIHFPPQRHFAGPLDFAVNDLGDVYVPDPTSSRALKLNARGQIVKSWKVPHDAPAPEDHPNAIALAADGSVFVAFPKTGRIEKYSSDGIWVASWFATATDAATPPAFTGFTVGGQFVFTIGPASPRLRVWTLDGQHKLDDDLGGHLEGVAAPQIEVTPSQELLIMDPAAPRIFRFRLHLQPEEQK